MAMQDLTPLCVTPFFLCPFSRVPDLIPVLCLSKGALAK